ncbi:MAG: F0F1 ATP synthase subunit delta [Verrucomicrobiota bacterium]
MLIDWFTVVAQIANFLALVWLLKRYLYQPILKAIDAREKRIADELAQAARQQSEAEKERAAFQHQNEILEQQRSELLSKARDEASLERQRLIDGARRDAESWRMKLTHSFERDQQLLTHELTRRAREEVFAIARQTLVDLSGATLEERISATFMRRLRQLNGEAREHLTEALKTASSPAIVRSAFPLPANLRRAINDALNETFSVETELEFQTAPNLISGIELSVNGRKVAWSIEDYLTSLEKSVRAVLEQRPRSEPDCGATNLPVAGVHEAIP